MILKIIKKMPAVFLEFNNMKITGYRKLKYQNKKYEEFVKLVSDFVYSSADGSDILDNLKFHLKKSLFDLYYDLTKIDD